MQKGKQKNQSLSIAPKLSFLSNPKDFLFIIIFFFFCFIFQK